MGRLILGGFLFGIGMALNGTCGLGTLRQLGGGDLKALISFLVIGSHRDDDHAGPDRHRAHLAHRAVHAAACRNPSRSACRKWRVCAARVRRSWPSRSEARSPCWRSAHSGFRSTLRFAATGAAVGALIVLGWWATGIAGFDAFDTRRIESFTFVGPLGETLYYFMLSTALQPDFPVGAVLGVIAGAFVAAKSDGSFKWEAPADANDMKRRLLGAFLMGFGGITALGCSIGQGVTGLSTLSVGSALATVAIVAGARTGLFLLVERKWTFRRIKTVRAVPAKAAVAHERISCTDP